MDQTDMLLTMAEIGVTIAGFSSLATLFLMAPAGAGLSLDAYRFEGMLVNSLLVIAFSLLPVLFDTLGLSEPLNWRLSSAILLLVFGSRGLMVTRSTLRYKKQGESIGRPFYAMTAILVVVVIVLSINVALPMGDRAPGLYLVGLCAVLTNACVLFLLVLLGALTAARTRDEKRAD